MFGASAATAPDLLEDTSPMPGVVSSNDPLQNLREYRHLAPWNLRDLTSLTAAILDAAGVRPVNAAAASLPSERTIRFYVAKQLVAPPEGRGTAATYSYRHLLQVLAIKLRQMEGANLAKLAEEMRTTSGDALERRIAHSLGTNLPAPGGLSLFSKPTRPTGRTGQAFRPRAERPGADGPATTPWYHLPIDDGIELHVRGDHPIAADHSLTSRFTEAVSLAARHLSSSVDTHTTSEPSDATTASPRPTPESSI
jgi:DNA-binding transcriptional MerR regulator